MTPRRLLTILGALGAGATATLAPATAQAYCRTTTDSLNEPRGYDPSVSGCYAKGTPLLWHNLPITYVLDRGASRQIGLAEAQRAVDAAFARWQNAACSPTDPAKHPHLTLQPAPAVEGGADDCGLRDCGPNVHDPEHVIIFRDDVWPHNDPSNTLALTTVTFGQSSGEIFDADMEINSHDHQLSAASPLPPGAFDLDAIVTHEAGHFIGFAHSDQHDAVMYVRYQSDATELHTDDVAAVCANYVAPADSASGCSCTTEPSTRASASGGALFLVAALARLRRRSRG